MRALTAATLLLNAHLITPAHNEEGIYILSIVKRKKRRKLL